MSETVVLSVGLDASILGARKSILRSAGYTVVSAMSVKEAFYLLKDGDFDLMILCHTLPVRDRERLISLVRASGSRIPVASISGAQGQQNIFSDVTLEQNPLELLVGIRRLLARQIKTASTRSSTARNSDQEATSPVVFRDNPDSGFHRGARHLARMHSALSGDASLAAPLTK